MLVNNNMQGAIRYGKVNFSHHHEITNIQINPAIAPDILALTFSTGSIISDTIKA